MKKNSYVGADFILIPTKSKLTIKGVKPLLKKHRSKWLNLDKLRSNND